MERAKWTSHALSRYAYVYEATGFLTATAGRQIHVVVLNGVVSSAQDMTTDSLLPATAFPTLDGLFDQALAALAAGTLTAITYDSTYDFPSRMDLAGPPDAGGSIFASSLEPVP